MLLYLFHVTLTPVRVFVAVTVIELTIRLVAADAACVDMAIMLVNIAIIMVSDNNLFFIFLIPFFDRFVYLVLF